MWECVGFWGWVGPCEWYACALVRMLVHLGMFWVLYLVLQYAFLLAVVLVPYLPSPVDSWQGGRFFGTLRLSLTP